MTPPFSGVAMDSPGTENLRQGLSDVSPISPFTTASQVSDMPGIPFMENSGGVLQLLITARASLPSRGALTPDHLTLG